MRWMQAGRRFWNRTSSMSRMNCSASLLQHQQVRAEGKDEQEDAQQNEDEDQHLKQQKQQHHGQRQLARPIIVSGSWGGACRRSRTQRKSRDTGKTRWGGRSRGHEDFFDAICVAHPRETELRVRRPILEGVPPSEPPVVLEGRVQTAIAGPEDIPHAHVQQEACAAEVGQNDDGRQNPAQDVDLSAAGMTMVKDVFGLLMVLLLLLLQSLKLPHSLIVRILLGGTAGCMCE
eukprot:3423310-Rhodomonas_salina.2